MWGWKRTLAAARGAPMIDYQAQLEKLRRNLPTKASTVRYALAGEVERAMTAANENASGTSRDLQP